MVAIRPMTEAEFEAFKSWSIEDYAQERSRNFGTLIDDERERAAAQYAELLPDGLHTEMHRFWQVTAGESGQPVGQLWVEVNDERRSAFIFFIGIDEAWRGRGYGKGALTALEAELRPLGIKRIGLNVFNDNVIAKGLYAAQGYYPTNVNMQKDL